MGKVPPTGGQPEGNRAETIFNRIRLSPSECTALFDTCPMPLWLVSQQTLLFLDANPAAIKMYGYTQEEFRAKKVTDLFEGEAVEPFLCAFESSQVGFVRAGTWRHGAKDGTSMDVDLVWTSLASDGQPCQLMLANEITERRWAEHLLGQVHAHTEQQLAARTMELDAATQEIESFAEALLKMASHLAATIDAPPQDSTCRRLEEMSEGLLRLAQLTYRPLAPRDMDLSQCAQEAGAEVERADPDHRVEFRIQPGIWVHADPELMRVVMTNLFRNAWLHTRQRPPAVIEFGAQSEGEKLICYVRDDGVGFERAMAEKLFLPFQRFNATHSEEGVGLSIVRRIIAKHAGRTWAEGTPNRGATIFFSLPIAKT